MTLRLSPLPKTWIFDVDGTLVIHNGHLRPEGDELLPGVKDFFAKIPNTDTIILLTARQCTELPLLEAFLQREGIRYNAILGDLPQGERILVNDTKPSGFTTAYSINKKRNEKLQINYTIDYDL